MEKINNIEEFLNNKEIPEQYLTKINYWESLYNEDYRENWIENEAKAFANAYTDRELKADKENGFTKIEVETFWKVVNKMLKISYSKGFHDGFHLCDAV